MLRIQESDVVSAKSQDIIIHLKMEMQALIVLTVTDKCFGGRLKTSS